MACGGDGLGLSGRGNWVGVYIGLRGEGLGLELQLFGLESEIFLFHVRC